MKPNVTMITSATFGCFAPFQDEFNEAIKVLKEQLKGLNTLFASGKTWVVGNQCTIVDIYLAGLLTGPFQTTLDSGFQKGMSAVTAWFVRVTKLPPFARAFGFVKVC